MWIHCTRTQIQKLFRTQQPILNVPKKSDSDLVWRIQSISIKGSKFPTHKTRILNFNNHLLHSPNQIWVKNINTNFPKGNINIYQMLSPNQIWVNNICFLFSNLYIELYCQLIWSIEINKHTATTKPNWNQMCFAASLARLVRKGNRL